MEDVWEHFSTKCSHTLKQLQAANQKPATESQMQGTCVGGSSLPAFVTEVLETSRNIEREKVIYIMGNNHG